MSVSDELGKLGDLHQRGLLSDDEFAAAKAKVLAAASAASASSGTSPAIATLNGLRRSQDDRWIGGVCGGLARLSGVESWVLRLGFVLVTLFAGIGLMAYVLLWLFVPQESSRQVVVQ